jgi:hypothetical protein
MWNKGKAPKPVVARGFLGLAALMAFAWLASAAPARADVVLHWDEIAVRTLTTQVPALSPFAQSRFAAIVQLAVFEAVNATTGEYEGYLGSPMAPNGAPIVAAVGASSEAAAIAAAHGVLVNYFPGNTVALNADRDASLAAIPDGPAKANGVAAGVAAAAALIAERVGDGASPQTFYQPPLNVPAGEWSITPGCPVDGGGNPLGGILLNWQNVRPFGFVEPASGHWSEAFRPAPPPAITSNRYAKDYDEVKRVGGTTSTERPDDRATVVRFYAAMSPTYLFHSVARQLAAERGDSLAANARNLALISIATADSLVASFATKYHYLYWRPVTAIRAGDTDDNPKTDQDAAFTPFITTPCFPSYPSNHASGSNGALEAIRRFYGAAGHAITLSGTIPVLGLVTLNYTSLKQISQDIDDARVYGGIHFRFDQVAGVRLGREVATSVVQDNLRKASNGRQPPTPNP